MSKFVGSVQRLAEGRGEGHKSSFSPDGLDYFRYREGSPAARRTTR